MKHKLQGFNHEFNFMNILERNLEVKLGDFLIKSFQDSKNLKPICVDSRCVIVNVLTKLLSLRSSFSKYDIDNALLDFERYPVIQMVDHGEVMLHKQMLMNNYMYNYAASSSGVNHLFIQQCTRVKAISNKSTLYGGAIIPRNGNKFLKIYKQGFDKLSKLPIVCMEPVKIRLQYFDVERKLVNNQTLPKILEEFDNSEHVNACSFLYKVNNHIWEQLKFSNKNKLVLFDEDFSSDSVSELLSNDRTALHLFFKNVEACLFYLDYRYKLKTENTRSCLDTTTDFFWYKSNKNLKPLRLILDIENKAYFVSPKDKDIKFEFTIENICFLLKTKTLYPDTSLTYLALSILPSISCLGGGSQAEYYPSIVNIVAKTFSKFKILDESRIVNMVENRNSKLFFYGLLEVDAATNKELECLDSQHDIDKLLFRKINKTIKESIGNLNAFEYFNYL